MKSELLNESLPVDLKITPHILGTFLSSSGWILEDADDISETWHHGDAQDRPSIRLPTTTRLRDFPIRFNESLRTLCEINDWSIEQLASAVIQVRSDVLLLRADELIRYDSIPIVQAQDLIVGSVKLLTAAARSTIEPRPTHRGRASSAVRAFMNDDVRMGHTQRGSFVVSIVTTLGDGDAINSQDGVDYSGEEGSSAGRNLEAGIVSRESASRTNPESESRDLSIASFQRRVMSTLARALAVVPNLNISSGTADLDLAVDSGVSAELCDALHTMTRFEGLRALDINFKWAPAEPVHHPPVTRLTLDRDTIPGLQYLTETFRQRDAPPVRQTIYGYVVRLERDQFTDNEDKSIALIRGVIGRSERRQIRVVIDGALHAMAISSYQNKIPVLLTGDLEKIGRDYWMTGEINLVHAPFKTGY
ncbi:hypothetical protein [Nocardia sp. bgisy134]|uniref:hypothetical protein n=1 Tax=Nocardia sp. bgisy134 TaxID=3413789 RepID=UPI003D74BB9A